MKRLFDISSAYSPSNSSLKREVSNDCMDNPERLGPSDLSPCSIFPNLQAVPHQNRDLLWYRLWLDRQLNLLPSELLNLLPDRAPRLEASSSLTQIFLQTASCLREDNEPAINKIVDHLIESKLFAPLSNEDDNVQWKERCHTLVFAILGWQTMLYQPSFRTCPTSQLAIEDSLDGFRGESYLVLKQDQTTDRLHHFLYGFGFLFPQKIKCYSQDERNGKAPESIVSIDCKELNMFLLSSIAHISIKWVEVLAPHLEFDQASNTLFLFRYPSFCVASLPCGPDYPALRSAIHSCADEDMSSDNWASESEITEFLRETLLTYRLLFGHNKAARRLFRTLSPYADIPAKGHDPLLTQLCGRKVVDISAFGKERDVYNLQHDFPMLRNRIAILKQQLSEKKPRGWKELWRDKRDSANWYTFWIVLIIGGLGLLMAFIQVVLQIVQVVYLIHPPT